MPNLRSVRDRGSGQWDPIVCFWPISTGWCVGQHNVAYQARVSHCALLPCIEVQPHMYPFPTPYLQACHAVSMSTAGHYAPMKVHLRPISNSRCVSQRVIHPLLNFSQMIVYLVSPKYRMLGKMHIRVLFMRVFMMSIVPRSEVPIDYTVRLRNCTVGTGIYLCGTPLYSHGPANILLLLFHITIEF